MAFTTDFPGSSLPVEWTFDSLIGDGSVSVANSRVEINCPNNVTHDSIFSNSSPENSVGIIANLPDHSGDMDVAVQCDTDVSDLKGVGVGLFGMGDTSADIARSSWYKPTSNGDEPFTYMNVRAAGAAQQFINATLNRYYSGIPAWLRLKYVSSTGTWTMMDSSDGTNWNTVVSNSRSFTPTRFKIGITSTSGQAIVPVYINKVVDILGLGSTDLRDAHPSFARTTIGTINGDEGSFPANFSDNSSGAGSSTSFTGSALRFTHDATQDNTPNSGGKFRAGIKWDGTEYEECGMIFKVAQSGSVNSQCYVAAGLFYDDGGGVPFDQYISAGGYGIEMQSGTQRRALRIDDPFDANVTISIYPDNLNRTPYTFLTDTTTTSLGSGARWVRMERCGRRFQMKEWADGDSEPSTWNSFDGQDEVETGTPLHLAINLSHNGVRTGSCTIDFTNIEFYSLTEIVGLPIKLGDATKTLKLGTDIVPLNLN